MKSIERRIRALKARLAEPDDFERLWDFWVMVCRNGPTTGDDGITQAEREQKAFETKRLAGPLLAETVVEWKEEVRCNYKKYRSAGAPPGE